MAYNNIAVSLFSLNKNKEAIKYFEKAIEIDPTNPTAYLNCGLAYRASKKMS
jgi:tetratricopeptide (TPR) repeat protein